jgi:hypothetical protein
MAGMADAGARRMLSSLSTGAADNREKPLPMLAERAIRVFPNESLPSPDYKPVTPCRHRTIPLAKH